MALKRKCGFENVCTNIFRKSLLEKGSKLWKSGHVLDLEEEMELHNNENCDPAEDGHRILRGLVLPQTSVSKKPYNVKIKVNKLRKVDGSHCECKAGQSHCKHKAAVLIAVNEEEAETKTSFPQMWGKPSNSVQQLYKKGHSIQQLFPQKAIFACPPIKKTPPLHYLQTLPSQPRQSVLSLMLKAESVEPDQVIIKDLLSELCGKAETEVEREKTQMLYSTIVSKQKKSILFFPYIVLACSDTKVYLKKTEPEMECNLAVFYYENVICSPKTAKDICLNTLKQSECKEWFSERSIRLSATTIHRIKTRQKDFENLSLQLLNKTRHGTAAMKYGIKTEPKARNKYMIKYKSEVLQCGLIVHYRQPWLCCSPDGFIICNTDLVLLEIKCTFKFRNEKFVNWDDKTCRISYLYFDGLDLKLKEAHSYYTQIQISLYVTRAVYCYLFVYSDVQSVRIRVERDDEFLSACVPKVEEFYFTHHLPLILRNRKA